MYRLERHACPSPEKLKSVLFGKVVFESSGSNLSAVLYCRLRATPLPASTGELDVCCRPSISLTVRSILTVMMLTLIIMNKAIYRKDFFTF